MQLNFSYEASSRAHTMAALAKANEAGCISGGAVFKRLFFVEMVS